MIIDTRSLPPDDVLETHVCIVGAGPTGLTLAHEFTNQALQVCLLESSGIELDPELQVLCDGTVSDDPYPEVRETRRRQLGGTSRCWQGQNGYQAYGFRCLPLDEIDFEQRDWLPYSGWLFPEVNLDPFYERAQNICQIGPYAYDVEAWETEQAMRLPFKSDRVTTTMSQYAPRYLFIHEYPDSIRQTPNITTVLYANVVEIETDETAEMVTRLRVASSPTKQFL